MLLIDEPREEDFLNEEGDLDENFRVNGELDAEERPDAWREGNGGGVELALEIESPER